MFQKLELNFEFHVKNEDDSKSFNILIDSLREFGKKEGVVGYIKYHECRHDIGESCPEQKTEIWGDFREVGP